MSDLKFNLCRSKIPKYYYGLKSLEIACWRFRKFNSKYIAGRYTKLKYIKLCTNYPHTSSIITVKRRDNFLVNS